MSDVTPRHEITRRTLLAAGTAVPLVAVLKHPAGAAEFEYKFATGQDPMHPVNKRGQEAIDRIREATGGPGPDQAVSGEPTRFGFGPAVEEHH